MEIMNISKSVAGKPPNEVGIGLKSLPRALYCGVLELLPPAWITIILLLDKLPYSLFNSRITESVEPAEPTRLFSLSETTRKSV